MPIRPPIAAGAEALDFARSVEHETQAQRPMPLWAFPMGGGLEAGASTSLPNLDVFFYPLFLQSRFPLYSYGFHVDTAATAGELRIALYRADFGDGDYATPTLHLLRASVSRHYHTGSAVAVRLRLADVVSMEIDPGPHFLAVVANASAGTVALAGYTGDDQWTKLHEHAADLGAPFASSYDGGSLAAGTGLAQIALLSPHGHQLFAEV